MEYSVGILKVKERDKQEIKKMKVNYEFSIRYLR